VRNSEIAAALRELGTLYELDGANRFRVLAYRDAANTVRDCPLSIAEMSKQGRLTELPGVGDTMATKIDALLYDELGIADLEGLRAAAEQEQIRDSAH
jgi:DNA polymerase (family 10)